MGVPDSLQIRGKRAFSGAGNQQIPPVVKIGADKPEIRIVLIKLRKPSVRWHLVKRGVIGKRNPGPKKHFFVIVLVGSCDNLEGIPGICQPLFHCVFRLFIPVCRSAGKNQREGRNTGDSYIATGDMTLSALGKCPHSADKTV